MEHGQQASSCPPLTGMSLSVVMLVAVAEIDVFATAATIYGNLKCTDMLLFTAISSVTLASHVGGDAAWSGGRPCTAGDAVSPPA